MAGPSSSQKFVPAPSTLNPPTLEIAHDYANGANQSNVTVGTATEQSQNAIPSPGVAAARRALVPSQNTPNVTSNLAPPRIQSHSSPTSSLNQLVVMKSGNTDHGNDSTDKEDASSMLSSAGQSRRVNVDSYPSRHRLVAGAMIALGGGSSHVPVTSEKLLNSLRSITYAITTTELTSYVLATVEAGILKRFVNDRGETWFSLENPVQSAPPQDVATSWIRSLVPSWF